MNCAWRGKKLDSESRVHRTALFLVMSGVQAITEIYMERKVVWTGVKSAGICFCMMC